MKIRSETQLTRGRCFSISGIDTSQIERILEKCLGEGGFHTRIRHTSQTTALITGTQRASWYRVLLSALPQRVVFELRDEPNKGRVDLTYDEQLAPWYLAFLIAIAAIMTPFWLGAVAMVMRLASAPTQLQDFDAAKLWVSAVIGVLFVRLMLASGGGTTPALLEEVRSRLRHLGATVDQQQTGTIMTKSVLSLFFLVHVFACALLGTLSAVDPVSLLFFDNWRKTIVAVAVLGALAVIGVGIVKGSLRSIKPIGGEERFAMVATGISIQFGVVCILSVQLAFLLLGQSTDEIWAMVFRAARFLEMNADQIRAAGLEYLPRERFVIGFNVLYAVAHTLLLAATAPACIGVILIARSVRLAPIVRRMCERVHEDIELAYGRAAASGDDFRQKSRRSFLTAWSLLAVFITLGLAGLLRLGVASFEFGYPGRTPEAAMGTVDATSNVINLLAGFAEHSYWGPAMSRTFFFCWAAAMTLPVLLALGYGYVHSLRNERRLMALSEALPSEATELNCELRDMASSVGLEVGLAISPAPQPRAAAHRVGTFISRKYVEVSERCLELLDAEEQNALVAHELGHHLRGHCLKHTIMQWLGRVTYVGGTFVTSMEDSFGFELKADRTAIEEFGVDRATLRKCLMKMRADAVVQRLRETNPGIGILRDTDQRDGVDPPRTIGFSGWRGAFRDWYALLRADAEMAYWHPSVADRVRALDEDDGQEPQQ